MTDACIGLGGNLGDPHRSLVLAAEAIDRLPNTSVTKRSVFYRADPIGPGTQTPYLNAALLISTGFSPQELLVQLQAIETRLGRVRGERWGPRTLDLDILLYADEHLSEEDLVIPHPRIRERNFVLAPLSDLLGSEAQVCGECLGDLLASAPPNGLEATSLPWPTASQQDCA